jgi:hypothetical protein
MSKKIQNKAKLKLKSIRQLLTKASKGKPLGDQGSDMFLNDAAELVKYYDHVSRGKFKKAHTIQTLDMDTATYDLIDSDIFYFIDDAGQ